MRVFHQPSSFHFFTFKILETTNTQQVEDMARIQPISIDKAPAPLKTAFFNHIAEYKTHITNTKATLGHSLPAFEAYMQWYPLYEQVQRLLGARLASLYAFTISEASHSPLCSTFFRKIIIDAGEEPDHLELSPEEQLLLDFGATIAREKGQVPDQLFRWVSVLYTDEQLVVLIAFAGQMIATNVFNNVIETEIDEYLIPYLPFVVAF